MRARSILFISLTAAGCYRYVPSELPSLEPGTRVSVDLTTTGAATVRPALGDLVQVVEGDITAASSAGLTLSLVSVRRRGDAAPSIWNGETVDLRAEDIGRVRLREMSRGRTVAAAAAVGAAGIGLVYAIARATGLLEVSGRGKGRPPNP